MLTSTLVFSATKLATTTGREARAIVSSSEVPCAVDISLTEDDIRSEKSSGNEVLSWLTLSSTSSKSLSSMVSGMFTFSSDTEGMKGT